MKKTKKIYIYHIYLYLFHNFEIIIGYKKCLNGAIIIVETDNKMLK